MKYLVIGIIFSVSSVQISGQYLKNLSGQAFSDEVLGSILYNTRGEKTSLNKVLDSLKGSAILIDFWASWCKTCISESSYIREIQKDYKDKKIKFLFLSTDTDYKQWLRGLAIVNLEGIHYRIDADSKKAIQNFLKIRGIPYYVFLDNENKIYDAKAPWPHLPKFRNELDMLLSLITIPKK